MFQVCFIGDARDRTLFRTHGWTGKGFDHLARAFGIIDPLRVEVVWAGCDTLMVLAGIYFAGVAAMQQLEQVIFGLHIFACITDQRCRQLRVLNAHILLAAFAHGAPVKADDGRVTEIRIHPIEAGRVSHRNIAVIGPSHGLGH